MARVLVSFLGTNDYVRCNYLFGARARVDSVRFVQEALVRHICADWTSDDRICIFLTNDAYPKNWIDGGHKDRNGIVICEDECGLPRKGLEQCLAGLRLQASITPLPNTPEGSNEQEIWDIFMRVQEQLHEGDQLWLDITHGFRSLPMLGMVMLQYVSVVKNVQVRGIHYGAFEVLGPAHEVRKMPLDKRNAPVLDLLSFHALQNWTLAADAFVRTGNGTPLKEAMSTHYEPLLKVSKGLDSSAKSIKRLAENLHGMGSLFETVRGKEIVDGGLFAEAAENALALANDPQLFAPVKPLLRIVNKRLAAFKRSSVANGFIAVEWCLEYGSVQQAITLLQEMVLTWVLEQTGQNWKSHVRRVVAAQGFAIVSQKMPQKEWSPPAKEYPDLILKIQEVISQYQGIAALYDKLAALRNDINHGGFIDENGNRARDGDTFTKETRKLYCAIRKCIEPENNLSKECAQ